MSKQIQPTATASTDLNVEQLESGRILDSP